METSNLLEEALTRPDHPPEAEDQGVPEVMVRLEKLRRVCRWSERPVGSPHSLGSLRLSLGPSQAFAVSGGAAPLKVICLPRS